MIGTVALTSSRRHYWMSLNRQHFNLILKVIDVEHFYIAIICSKSFNLLLEYGSGIAVLQILVCIADDI